MKKGKFFNCVNEDLNDGKIYDNECYSLIKKWHARKTKILIIEDDMMIAKTTAEHLIKWDFDAVCVTDFKNIIDAFLPLQVALGKMYVNFVQYAN